MWGGELYRYAFQGQEKDLETGKEAFQLRLWDSRIGRWLTTDPAGQYASPYLGMGNNPISRVDPDGGSDACRDPEGNVIPCGDMWQSFEGNTLIDANFDVNGEFSHLSLGSVPDFSNNIFSDFIDYTKFKISRYRDEFGPDGVSINTQLTGKIIFFDFSAGIGAYSGSYQEGLASAFDLNFTTDWGVKLNFDFQSNLYYSGRQNNVMYLRDFVGDEIGAAYSWKNFNVGYRQSLNPINSYDVYSIGSTINMKKMLIKWLPESNNNVQQSGSYTGDFFRTWKIN